MLSLKSKLFIPLQAYICSANYVHLRFMRYDIRNIGISAQEWHKRKAHGASQMERFHALGGMMVMRKCFLCFHFLYMYFIEQGHTNKTLLHIKLQM